MMNANRRDFMKTATAAGLGAAVAAFGILPSALGEGTWTFKPVSGNPKPPLVDLRYLNEDRAGQYGFVSLSPDGNSLLRGDGRQIRFWGVNNAKPEHFTREEFLDHLDWLASLGVNMIRWNYVDFNARRPDAGPNDVNQESIDQFIWGVEEAAKRGIYSYALTGGCYHSFEGVDIGSWGIEGFEGPCKGLDPKWEDGEEKPFGVIYVETIMQDAYKYWLKVLLTTKSPRTGKTLAENPALMCIQLMSEDGLLWYSFNKIKQPQLQKLGRHFAKFLKRKYGSLEAADKAWGHAPIWETWKNGRPLLADDFANDIAGFVTLHQATSRALPNLTKPQRKRLADQIEFLATFQVEYQNRMIDYIKRDLGAKQLVVSSNWKGADRLLMDSERWMQTSGDICAENSSMTRINSRKRNGERFYADRSALDAFENLFLVPLVGKLVEGRPYMLTNPIYYQPNRYQLEAAFQFAAYGSLSGMDGVAWEAFYFSRHLRGGNRGDRSCAQPNFAYTWPAAALIYRENMVAEGEVILRETPQLQDLWNEKEPTFTEWPPHGKDSLAPFFIGQLRCHYPPHRLHAVKKDYSGYLDAEAGIVRATNDQLMLNWKKGYCLINAPKAQGICGRMNRHEPVKLADVTVTGSHDPCAVYVVSMDHKPIRESGRLFLQVNTPAEFTGRKIELVTLKSEPNPIHPFYKIIEEGALPWQIENASVALRINNRHVSKGTALNEEFKPVGEFALKREGDAISFHFPAQALYAVIER